MNIKRLVIEKETTKVVVFTAVEWQQKKIVIDQMMFNFNKL